MAAAREWTFTTDTGPGGMPATLWTSAAVPAVLADNDTAAIELGVRFTGDCHGAVTRPSLLQGRRQPGSPRRPPLGPTGTLLGTVAFENETATGWQQATFATPVADQGRDRSTWRPTTPPPAATRLHRRLLREPGRPRAAPHRSRRGERRVPLRRRERSPTDVLGAANYWVDVLFGDSQAPTVTNQHPRPGRDRRRPPETAAIGHLQRARAARPRSCSSSATPAARSWPAPASYDAASRTATFLPGAPLASGSTFTATVSGALDLAGNPLAGPRRGASPPRPRTRA